MTITLQQANAILQAATDHAEKLATAPLTMALLDSGGCLKALWRHDGASTLRPEMAAAKARTAIGLGKSSRKVAEDAGSRPVFIGGLSALAGGPFVRTADFPKEWNTRVYFRLRKIRCADKGQARARVIGEISGLEPVSEFPVTRPRRIPGFRKSAQTAG